MDVVTNVAVVSIAGSVVVTVASLIIGVAYAVWLHLRGVDEPEKKAATLLKASRSNRFTFHRHPNDEDEKDQLPPAA
jgi:hypothetical protein